MKIPDCWARHIIDTDQRTSKLNMRDSLQISLMNIMGKYRSHTILAGHKLISEFVNIFMWHIFKITLVV